MSEKSSADLISKMSNHSARAIIRKNILIPADTIVTQAPSNIALSPGHYQLTIGIGNDEVATLIIHEEALCALNLMNPAVVIF